MPNSATTLTLFCAGSGNNLSESHSKKFAVPRLTELAVGRHHAVNGVGGNLMSRKRYEREGKGHFKLEDGRKRLLPGAKTFWIPSPDKISGHWVGQLVRNGFDYIKTQNEDETAPAVEAINLYGFSRGAVCCIKLSHLVSDYFSEQGRRMPEINIFLFDPVAGAISGFSGQTSNGSKKVNTPTKELPAAVTRFRGIVQPSSPGCSRSRTGCSSPPCLSLGARPPTTRSM